MAKMEHGRWNRQKLQEGWRWGAERDHATKTTPYLVQWEKLDDNIK